MQHHAATKHRDPAEDAHLDHGPPGWARLPTRALWASACYAALLLSACFPPGQAQPLCGPHGKCESGLTCTARLQCEPPSLVDDANTEDPLPDAPIDAPAPTRTRASLVGLWEFDETDGATGAIVNDTSTTDPTKRVQLTLTSGTVSFSAGTMTPNGVIVIASEPYPHVNLDVKLSQAVTLEAWVMASAATQGASNAPVVIAGTSSSINARNISLMQAGKRWIARVRTTASGNGLPDLISTTDLTPGVMTHLAVVSDATRRILYINGKRDKVDPAPGPPANWDRSYRMMIGDELSRNRQWAGTFALVAMYSQALSDAQIDANFQAGPDAR